jgi:hypothetical protein
MTSQVKTFFSKVTDEYGGEYPNAFVAVRAFSETSQTTGYSENCEDSYSIESDLDAITYRVNYWYSDITRANGKRSRPLNHEENGVFSDVFTVDLMDLEVIKILSGDYGHTDKVLDAIKADITRKFN